MPIDRRNFIKSGAGATLFSALPVFKSFASQYDKDKAKEQNDPGKFLVRDGLKFAKKGKSKNIPPVLREEILENPNAVFLIHTDVKSQKDNSGKFPAEKEQFFKAGYDAMNGIFRKGSSKGGTTYIKPNFVGGFDEDERNLNNGVSTHPSFVTGFCKGLQELGNTNIVVGANGAAKHEHFVQSGVCDMLHKQGVCFTEGKYESWKDYIDSEITWVDYPDGIVMKKIPYFKLTQEKDTTFINMAKDRIHQLGFTTLTIKNLQGIMPVGYMHICRDWGSKLRDVTNLDPGKGVVNPDFQRQIERLYIKHARMNYKYWDEGGFSAAYFKAGGWDAYKRGAFKPDYKVFWGEQWGERMLDIDLNIHPCVNMVEGIVGVDGANNLHLNNFITISRNMAACDSVACWLMGHDPREMPFLRIANERGLGENDIEKIPLYEIKGNSVEKIKDYRTLERGKMGVNVYGLGGRELRYF